MIACTPPEFGRTQFCTATVGHRLRLVPAGGTGPTPEVGLPTGEDVSGWNGPRRRPREGHVVGIDRRCAGGDRFGRGDEDRAQRTDSGRDQIGAGTVPKMEKLRRRRLIC